MSIFKNVKVSSPKKTGFDLSHEVKLSTEFGKLTPVLCEEVVPGDKWQINTESLVRLAPLIAPVMHRIDLYIHYFYVPNRLIWSRWEDFITGEYVGTIPQIALASAQWQPGSPGDYLGLPVDPFASGQAVVSQMPFRAYWKIWNDYYRDENLQTEIDVESLVTADYMTCAYRSWGKDYFTSALPWAQKGDPVSMQADVTYMDEAEVFHATYPMDTMASTGIGHSDAAGGNKVLGVVDTGTPTPANIGIENIDSIGIEINEFRTANTLQKYLEKLARGGSRYKEFLLNFFGVNSKDARLDRPEFIGGGKVPVTISEVVKTSSTDGTSPQGEMAGHGIAVGQTGNKYHFCDEHGYIMGILSCMPKAGYHQGLHRKWSRSVNTDFYNPEFAHLGEQEVKNKEIYLQGSGAGTSDDDVFGYQSIWSEYKYTADRVCGDFADFVSGGLEHWHLIRHFGSLPALNEDFVTTEAEKNELQGRIFAAGYSKDTLWIQLYHKIKAVRPMPYYGTPRI